MWICPTCARAFAKPNQGHTCTEVTVDDLFARSADNVLLAFDGVLVATADLEPNYVGAAKRAVVFTKRTAWLIARPARGWLDVIVAFADQRHRAFVHRVRPHFSGKRYEHVVRLREATDLTPEVADFLRRAHAEAP